MARRRLLTDETVDRPDPVVALRGYSMPVFLAGVRIAAVTVIGIATIGAVIDAGDGLRCCVQRSAPSRARLVEQQLPSLHVVDRQVHRRRPIQRVGDDRGVVERVGMVGTQQRRPLGQFRLAGAGAQVAAVVPGRRGLVHLLGHGAGHRQAPVAVGDTRYTLPVGLAFDGTKYHVTYKSGEAKPNGEYPFYVRSVDTAGTLGMAHEIDSDPNYYQAPAVAFDGRNLLVAYEIDGRGFLEVRSPSDYAVLDTFDLGEATNLNLDFGYHVGAGAVVYTRPDVSGLFMRQIEVR